MAKDPISPLQFGTVCGHVARSLHVGLKPDAAVQLAVTEFYTLDPIDVADISEGAIEQWHRLQVREPEET
jgi:hypothetical protein